VELKIWLIFAARFTPIFLGERFQTLQGFKGRKAAQTSY